MDTYNVSDVAELRDAAEQLASLLAADDILDIGPLLRSVLNAEAEELEQAVVAHLDSSEAAEASPISPCSTDAFVVEWAWPQVREAGRPNLPLRARPANSLTE